MTSTTDINTNHLKETMKIAISDEIKNENQGMKLRSDHKDKDEEMLSVASLETILNKVFSQFIDAIVPMLEYVKNESIENDKIVMENIQEVKDDLVDTQIELDKKSQYGRRENIRLHNVPEPKLQPGQREDTNAAVIKILHDAGHTAVKPEDISVSHRIPIRDKAKPKPLIARFVSRDVRNKVMFNKRDIKNHHNTKLNYPELFITEDLTPLRQQMSYELRQDENIAHVWSIDGKIKCLKKNYTRSDRPITIDTPHDFKKVGWQPNQITSKFLRKIYKRQSVATNDPIAARETNDST